MRLCAEGERTRAHCIARHGQARPLCAITARCIWNIIIAWIHHEHYSPLLLLCNLSHKADFTGPLRPHPTGLAEEAAVRTEQAVARPASEEDVEQAFFLHNIWRSKQRPWWWAPKAQTTVWDIIRTSNDHRTLTSLIQANDLVSALNRPGLTVFAPTDMVSSWVLVHSTTHARRWP